MAVSFILHQDQESFAKNLLDFKLRKGWKKPVVPKASCMAIYCTFKQWKYDGRRLDENKYVWGKLPETWIRNSVSYEYIS